MLDQIFDAAIVLSFPCPGNSKNEKPTNTSSGFIFCLNGLDIVFAAISRISDDNHTLSPIRRPEVLEHFSKKRIFFTIFRMGFWQDKTKIHGNADIVPTYAQKHKTDSKKRKVCFYFHGLSEQEDFSCLVYSYGCRPQ